MAEKGENMTEKERYYRAEYPYDLAECGLCLLMHKHDPCQDHKHAEIGRVAKEILPGGEIWSKSGTRRTFTNLRELFRDFYPQQPVEAPVRQPEFVKTQTD